MKYLNQLALIFLIYFAGEAFSSLSGLPIPGNITGMILLLVLLVTGIIKESQIREAADFLLEHIVLFLIVPGVNLLRDFSLLSGYVTRTLLMMVLTTVLTMVTAGLVAKWLIRATGGHRE